MLDTAFVKDYRFPYGFFVLPFLLQKLLEIFIGNKVRPNACSMGESIIFNRLDTRTTATNNRAIGIWSNSE